MKRCFMEMLRPSRDVLVLSVLFATTATYFASWLPDITNVVGIEGSHISSVVSFGALNGMVFGPVLGPFISLSGILLHGITNPHFFSKDGFHLISPLFVVFSSLIGGLLLSGRKKMALALYTIPLVAWYAFSTGRTVFYYPWYHILLLIIFYEFDDKYSKKISASKFFLFVYLFLIASISVLADHIVGSTTALIFYDLPPAMFISVTLLYPVERSVLALCSAFVVYVLFLIVRVILQDIKTFEDKAREIKEGTIEDYMQIEVKKILDDQEK
ncbi:MAG: hypothetical protein KK926_04715 [Methanomethylovorans sp.]|nr:hypothetical protein [Methanomethylovorans sp.]